MIKATIPFCFDVFPLVLGKGSISKMVYLPAVVIVGIAQIPLVIELTSEDL